MATDYDIERVRAVKDAYESELLDKANVVGVGIGMREVEGQPTGELSIVVSVTHKAPPWSLDAGDLVPRELDGVPVDVKAIGTPAAS